MIDQLIQQIAQKVGLDESMAKQALGVVLSLLQKEGDSSAVAGLFDKIPGAADLAREFEPENQAAGLGGLLGKVGGMLGGNAGDAMFAFGALKQTGLSMDQAQEMLPVVKGFLQENAGEETLNQVIASVPALKNFLN